MKTLTMRRKGEFTVKTYGDNPCGTEPEQKIRYRLMCVCANVLDERGFLFDQMAVQDFFDAIEKTDMSCEELVAEAVTGILIKVHEENPSCRLKKVRLLLAPAPYSASMSFSIRGDALADLMDEIEDGEHVAEFMRDAYAQPRTESTAPASTKKKEVLKPKPVWGLYHTRQNIWLKSDGGEGPELAFASEAEAEDELLQGDYSRLVKVQLKTPVDIATVAASNKRVESAKRWGIWNRRTQSWMHAKGSDRVYGSQSEATDKIAEKRNGHNGRNWAECEARPYTGTRDPGADDDSDGEYDD